MMFYQNEAEETEETGRELDQIFVRKMMGRKMLRGKLRNSRG
jgi:hypothetical protein